MQSTTGRTRPRLVAGAAVALSLIGVVGIGVGLASQEGPAPTPPAGTSEHHHAAAPATTPTPSPSAVAGAPRAGAPYEQFTGPQLDRSDPVRVRIPSLDVSSSVIDLGMQANRRMEVPQDGVHTGWFTGSPTPGEVGPAVLAAHVTWRQKPAVFFELGALRKGQKVEVERRDGSVGIFEVTKVGQYPKADFPTDEVYGSIDHAGLRLITCGGVLDGETGHHVDNVVVYAKLTGSRRA